MRDLSLRLLPEVSSLPTPGAANTGSIVRLAGDGKPYYCDGTQWIDLTAGQAAWALIDDTDSPYSATAGERLMVDTSAGVVTVTLPASPTAGDKVVVSDYAGTFATYNLTVGRNGSDIMALAEDMTVSDNHVTVELEYIDATKGWTVI